jgi:uncharacterized membrane protein
LPLPKKRASPKALIMLSFVLMTELGLRPAYMAIFRVSLCSMAFYTSAMFCFTFLLHLDLRRPALLIVLTFLVLNGVMTVAGPVDVEFMVERLGATAPAAPAPDAHHH